MRDSQIRQQIEYLQIFKNLAQSFQEIASQRMKKIRQGTLSSRDYMDEVYKIFNTVRNAYKKELESIRKRGRGGITFLPHNGRSVDVFLSANTGLYGGIMKETLDEMMTDYRINNTEVTVVGRYGSKLFNSLEPDAAYTYFDFPDFGSDEQLILEIIKHIVQYESVKVYYPKFENIVNQVPGILSISSGIDPDVSTLGEDEKKPYIFEPELEKILMFFEAEIFASIFNQTIQENHLAKSASRVMAMDRSTQNSLEQIKALKLQKLRIKHRELNKKQMSRTFAVMFNRSGYN